MAADRPRAPRRSQRWLLALLAVPAIALAGTLVRPSDPQLPTIATTGTTTASGSAVVDTTGTPSVDAAAVLAAVDAAATAAGGTITVTVLDAGGRQLVASTDADATEYTASLVKLLVVQQLLARDAAGTLTLDDGDLARMERAVAASDDDAMSELWVAFDGAGLVADAAAEFGLTGTAPPEVVGQWGESTTTAADCATFLAGLGDHLDAADLVLLTGWMQSTSATAADGFDQDYGLVAADTGSSAVAAKQGWMCCLEAERQMHSAGVLADGRVVVLLGDFPTSTSWSRARAALDTAAQAVVSGT